MKPVNVRDFGAILTSQHVVDEPKVVRLTNYAEINYQLNCNGDRIDTANEILVQFFSLLPGRHVVTSELIQAFYEDVTAEMPGGSVVIPYDTLTAWYDRTVAETTRLEDSVTN